jgi:periplasmic protein CpxP/Spy
MKPIFAALAIFFLAGLPGKAQDQEQKIPTPEEMATKEADRLADLLKLEDWQVFYVDSTLQHDYAACQDEMKKLQAARVDNVDMYTAVRDRWMEQIDRTYKSFFTDEQWAAYLKSGAAKAQKAREKRKAKVEKANAAQKRPLPPASPSGK